MSSVLFVAPFTFGESGEVSAQCVATQDCASLGYTEASCPVLMKSAELGKIVTENTLNATAKTDIPGLKNSANCKQLPVK